MTPVVPSEWSIQGATTAAQAYIANPGPGSTAVSLFNLGISSLNVASVLQLETKLSTNGLAGFIFDRYDAETFKFAAIDVVKDQVIIGHRTRKGWTADAVVARDLTAGVLYTLGLTLKGTTVSLTLNGSTLLGFVFNAATVDGRFGLLATGGRASFDDLLVQTNDRAFVDTASPVLAAASLARPTETSTLESSQLQPLIDEAIARMGLNEAQLTILRNTPVRISDLAGDQFGSYADGVVWIDIDAAGYGWFIDTTPSRDEEFRLVNGRLVARSQDSIGKIDLLSVLMHEFGHVLGLEHTETVLMAAALPAGTRSSEPVDQTPGNTTTAAPVAAQPLRSTQAATGGFAEPLTRSDTRLPAQAKTAPLLATDSDRTKGLPDEQPVSVEVPGSAAGSQGVTRGAALLTNASGGSTGDPATEEHHGLLHRLRFLRRIGFGRTR